MFFRNAAVLLFVKFLWMGLVFGLASIVLKTIAKICKKNVFVVNFLTFVYWIVFGGVYLLMCFMFNNYSVSLIGLGGMLAGVLVIKISIDFFFDYFIRFIYNEFIILKGKRKNGKIQTSKKI